VGFGAWKTIGSEVRSCLHVSDPSSLALAFSRTGTAENIATKNAQENASFVVKEERK
jgi:hypothetical protein